MFLSQFIPTRSSFPTEIEDHSWLSHSSLNTFLSLQMCMEHLESTYDFLDRPSFELCWARTLAAKETYGFLFSVVIGWFPFSLPKQLAAFPEITFQESFAFRVWATISLVGPLLSAIVAVKQKLLLTLFILSITSIRSKPSSSLTSPLPFSTVLW